MIEPIFEVREGMSIEECAIGATMRNLPSRCLCAILTKLKRMRLGRLCPGATNAHVSFRLILMGKKRGSFDRQALSKKYFAD
jgi:hypothetical protein